MKTSVTPTLENYLKAILLLQQKNPVVRVKDLSAALGLKMASVAGGLKTLKKKGLVIHEKYGYVELSQKGYLAASEVTRVHRVLYRFFRDILSVEKGQAEEDACAIEHYISAASLSRLIRLLEYFTRRTEKDVLDQFRSYIATHDDAPGRSLASMPEGGTGEILAIEGESSFKRKLLGLGMVPGTRVTMERVAPFGSPVIVRVRDSLLTLRRDEVEAVRVRAEDE